MEKKTPHYNLPLIQADVRRLGAVAFTKSALDGGRTMGLTLAQMQRVIATLERRSLYKSMSTTRSGRTSITHRPTVWPSTSR